MMPTADLPPRPDPWTGLPVPPPAPGPRQPVPARRMPTRPRPAPPGRGPVLAGRSGDRRAGVVLLVGGLVVFLVFVELVVGLDRVAARPGVWVPFALAAVPLVFWARSIATSYLAVGADWLQAGRAWVDLYDLVEVKGSPGANAQPGLTFRDGAGRQVHQYVRDLRADPLMWDLIYLGLRWSRATQEVRVNRAAEMVVGDDPLPAGALGRRRRVAVVRVRRDDPRTAELPPRPDPRSCRPVPPPAPWTAVDAAPRVPRFPQSSPPGRGPLVGGRSGVDVRGLTAFAVGLVLVDALLVWLVGVDAIAANPVDTAVYGTCLLLVVTGVAWATTVTYAAAGADWAADEYSWVDVYDLVAVRVARTRWGVPALQLTDGEGRRVVMPLRDVRADALLGRYVHLGIRWSQATNVVEIDDAARTLTGLD